LAKEATTLKTAEPHPTEPTQAEVAAGEIDPVARVELMRQEVAMLILQAALATNAPPPREERDTLRDLSPFGR
jgi:hypothetical protein